MQTKIIYRGTNTEFGDGKITVQLLSNIENLEGFTAKFKLQHIEKTFEDLTSRKIEFNLNEEETKSLELGKWTCSFTIFDSEERVFANYTDTLFDVRENPNVR